MAATQVTGRQIGPLDLTTEVSGILPAANGGTGLSTGGTADYILRWDGTAWVASKDFYDMSIVVCGTYTPRVAGGYGDLPWGVLIQRPIRIEKITARFTFADPSGSSTIRMRKNRADFGTPAEVTVTSPSLTGNITGTWDYAEGDTLEFYINTVGGGSNVGLIMDLKGFVI